MPLRIALRSLRRSPGFAALAVLILTLGIGTTTAMFSITRTILLKPLAYRDPQQLVTVAFRIPQIAKQFSALPVNALHYQLWRDGSQAFAEVSLMAPQAHILSGIGEAEETTGVRVTANYFHVLGCAPEMGRAFTPGEDQKGRNGVAIISHRFWHDKLSGRRDVIGTKLLLDGDPFEVIGVMPAAFPTPAGNQLVDVEELPAHTDYWTPAVFSKEDLESPLGNMNYIAVARLKPGVTLPSARADLNRLEKVIARTYPQPVEVDPVVRPLQGAMAQEVRLPLLILMAAVSAVLLIVCINLMNLMMVRAIAHRREWAIRLAIGAGVRDLVSGALTESLLLSVAGAALGALLSAWMLEIVRLKAPANLPRIDELRLDPAALLFALGAAVVSALLFAVWPAWRSARIDPQEALQASGRSATEGRKGHRTGRALVAAEVALSTALLLMTGLLLRSFETVLAVDPGMNVQQLLTARIKLPPAKYKQASAIDSFYKRLTTQASSLPGVIAAGVVSDLPLTTENNNDLATAGDRAAPPLTQWPITNERYASSDYFKAAGIPVKEGSAFEQRDGANADVMISANLAATLWPKGSAVGRPLKIYGDNHVFKVAGVVGSVHAATLTQPPSLMVYYPAWTAANSEMTLVVRTQGEPQGLSSTVRRLVRRLEPEAAIPSVETMQEVVQGSLASRRFQLMLLAGFAGSALALACLGIYGVLAFATGRRTSEIGIRMALGARPKQIFTRTLQAGLAPVLAGILAGLALSAALAHILETLLFQVNALDPLMYALTALILLAVSSLACFVPARRASRLNPVEALRRQ